MVFCLWINNGFGQERLSVDTGISEYRQQKIIEATEQISEVLEQSIETLKEIAQLIETEAESDYEKKLLRIWDATFKGNHANEILERFESLQQQFNENLTHIRYASQTMCETKTQASLKKVIKLAFVLMLRNRVTGEIVPYDAEGQTPSHEAIVNLCDHWFDSIGFLDQIASLVHELTHWYLKTEDHAYVYQHAKYKALTAHEHKSNADSYAYFIKQVLLLKPLQNRPEV
ncbi:MAG TPA: M35 family metallo-endopeptidase [Oligoflexia bacterium]|nr:M35 family metallo-endopeptidase [Oligoflexia bacterium]